MNNPIPANVPFAKPYQSVTAAVAALTKPQLDRLQTIARRRLERLTWSASVHRLLVQSEPADFVQDAILLVLVGELQPGHGRNTHARHLAGQHAFFNFLQGIIHSRINAQLMSHACQAEHVSMEEENSTVLPAVTDVVQEVQFNELKIELNARPRAFAGDNLALQSTLQLLELDGNSETQKPSRQQLCRMRREGRKIFRQLIADEGLV